MKTIYKMILLSFAFASHMSWSKACEDLSSKTVEAEEYLENELACLRVSYPDYVRSVMDFKINRHFSTRKIDLDLLLSKFISDTPKLVNSMDMVVNAWEGISTSSGGDYSSDHALQKYLLLQQAALLVRKIKIINTQVLSLSGELKNACNSEGNFLARASLHPQVQFPIDQLNFNPEDYSFRFEVSYPVYGSSDSYSYNSGVRFSSSEDDKTSQYISAGCSVAGAGIGCLVGAPQVGFIIGASVGESINFLRSRSKYVAKYKRSMSAVYSMMDVMADSVAKETKEFQTNYTSTCKTYMDENVVKSWEEISVEIQAMARILEAKFERMSQSYSVMKDRTLKNIENIEKTYLRKLSDKISQNMNAEIEARQKNDDLAREKLNQARKIQQSFRDKDDSFILNQTDYQEEMWTVLIEGDLDLLTNEEPLVSPEKVQERGLWTAGRSLVVKELKKYENN